MRSVVAARSPPRWPARFSRHISTYRKDGERPAMLKIDRRLIAHFDWPLLICTLLIVGCGLVTVGSATHSDDKLLSGLVLRQLIWTCVGLVALLAVIAFDYHWLERYGYFI